MKRAIRNKIIAWGLLYEVALVVGLVVVAKTISL